MTPLQITHSTPPDWIGNEYSSVCPFNGDNSRLLLIARDHFIECDDGGTFIRDLPIAATEEPRWSRIDPWILYFIQGNTLEKFDLVLGTAALVHEFSEYTKISGKGESDISRDGDHFVFCGTRPDGADEVFIYALSTNTKGPVFPQKEPFDGLKISGVNLPILSKASGISILDGSPRKITNANGHAVPARFQGKDYLVWCSSNDLDLDKNAVVLVDIDNGSQRILHEFDWRYAFHLSSCDRDFVLASTYAPDGSLPSQLWKLPLDGSGSTLLGTTGSLVHDYNGQPKAALSRDGTRLVFSSNAGNPTPNYCDTFLMTLDDSPQPAIADPPLLTEIDFATMEGRQWQLDLKVVAGKLTAKMFDKV